MRLFAATASHRLTMEGTNPDGELRVKLKESIVEKGEIKRENIIITDDADIYFIL